MRSTSTPRNISKHVRRLCKKIGTTEEPIFIEVTPRPDAGFRDCFNDTKQHVIEHGGALLHGWLIWEWPGIMMEGEFHAVWQDKSGKVVDVSSKEDGESSILFVPDSRRCYRGIRIDNIRIPIGKNPEIKTFIAMSEKFHKLFKHYHGDAVGEVVLAPELASLHEEMIFLGRKLTQSREARKAYSQFYQPHE